MNYNDFIEAALKEGADFEQIAADFSKALNERQQVIKEQKAKDEAREECITVLLDNIDHWWNSTSNENALAIAADLAAYAAAKTHEDWTADRLRQFAHDAKEQLEALISLYEMEDQGDPFARVLRKGLDIGSNKSKEEEKKKTAAPVGKAGNEDAEQLLRFLRQLGL